MQEESLGAGCRICLKLSFKAVKWNNFGFFTVFTDSCGDIRQLFMVNLLLTWNHVTGDQLTIWLLVIIHLILENIDSGFWLMILYYINIYALQLSNMEYIGILKNVYKWFWINNTEERRSKTSHAICIWYEAIQDH